MCQARFPLFLHPATLITLTKRAVALAPAAPTKTPEGHHRYDGDIHEVDEEDNTATTCYELNDVEDEARDVGFNF